MSMPETKGIKKNKGIGNDYENKIRIMGGSTSASAGRNNFGILG